MKIRSMSHAVIIDFLQETATNHMMDMFITPDNKLVFMDARHKMHFKFDISFTDLAFNCVVLGRNPIDDNTMLQIASFNIAWADYKGICAFKDYVVKITNEAIEHEKKGEVDR